MTHVCCDKHVCRDKSFVATKIILVAVPVNGTFQTWDFEVLSAGDEAPTVKLKKLILIKLYFSTLKI